MLAAAVAAVLLVAGTRIESRGHAFYRGSLAFVGVIGISIPALINAFVHFDQQRYFWVIAQPGVCAHLGSGGVLVVSLALGLCLGFGSLGMLLATRRPREPFVVWSSVGIAAIVIAAVGALVIAAPQVVASLICA